MFALSVTITFATNVPITFEVQTIEFVVSELVSVNSAIMFEGVPYWDIM